VVDVGDDREVADVALVHGGSALIVAGKPFSLVFGVSAPVSFLQLMS
jgi:hypothetical protein